MPACESTRNDIFKKQNIFFLRQNLIFQPLCLHVYSFKEKNEGNFRVTACMIKTRSLSKWSHLLEISKGGTIRFKIGLLHSISVFEKVQLGNFGALRSWLSMLLMEYISLLFFNSHLGLVISENSQIFACFF